MKKYINDKGEYAGTNIMLDGSLVMNPTEEMLIEAGYHEYVAPAKTLEEAKKKKDE